MIFISKRKILVVEGLDGSGKKTQSLLLQKKLKSENCLAELISFPNYENKSSAFLKMYLNGEFGFSPGDTNPYAASSFFAIDRFINLKLKLENEYKNSEIIICDRYTTSNIIYQMPKLEFNKWDSFLKWLEDFEYVRLGIPSPDVVVYLDMSIKLSDTLLKKRYGDDISKKDIHESDLKYLSLCQEAAYFAAEKFNWHIIRCYDNNDKIYSEKEISDQIFECVKTN
ncbi:MAG: thymidylate kinase [Candidatus Improbicoccus pseudotrichonymphae]|uniref:Thymidylate kinase n=1 Tax=Candidatus Improbicoccus pseudotrichonymphae TaxID=3033792 RepID=A0AA48KVJ9_9FIRM|nr:MAG: thymidylate kinase [Candidatus Improbicoccus pseudotrichonymphae]